MTTHLHFAAPLLLMTGVSLTFAACTVDNDEAAGAANNELNASVLHCTALGQPALDVTPTLSEATLEVGGAEVKFNCQPSGDDDAGVVVTCISKEYGALQTLTITKKDGKYEATMGPTNLPPGVPQFKVTFRCSTNAAPPADGGPGDAATYDASDAATYDASDAATD